MKRYLLTSLFLILALATTASAADPVAALKLPPYKKVKLKNGMTLLLVERHSVPLIGFYAIVKAGSVADTAGKEATASMTATLLRKGTKTRTADQFSSELDFVGGQFGAGAGADYTAISAEFVKKDIAKGLDLFADALLNPTFPQDEFTKLLKQRVDGLKASKDQAQAVAGAYFNAWLFGSHPYGRPAETKSPWLRSRAMTCLSSTSRSIHPEIPFLPWLETSPPPKWKDCSRRSLMSGRRAGLRQSLCRSRRPLPARSCC